MPVNLRRDLKFVKMGKYVMEKIVWSFFERILVLVSIGFKLIVPKIGLDVDSKGDVIL